MSLTVNSVPRYKGLSGASPQLQDSGIADDGTTITTSRDLTVTGDITADNFSGTNTGDVTLAGTPDYITITNQIITRGLIDQAADVTGVLPVANGGSGLATTPTDGQLLIGKTDGTYALAALTAGTGMVITNDDGSITLESTASGGAETGANSDITSMTGLTGYLTAPIGVKDSSGNEVVKFASAASAVNEITITNAATGDPAKIDATGGDTDIDILVTPAGTGTFQIAGSAGAITSGTTNAALTITGNGTGGVAIGNALTEKVVTLSPGATPALDASLGNIFTLAMAGDYTIGIPSNAVSGQKIVIRATSDGTARTLALNTGAGGFRFGSDITGLTETAISKTDYIGCIYNAADSKWDVVAYSKGF